VSHKLDRSRSLKIYSRRVVHFIRRIDTFAMQPSLTRLSVLPRISQPFKRSQEGLFHGKMKQYGNNVPHSKHKTRRTWLPNVQSKRLPLEATGETLKLKVTTRALRCIHKVCPLLFWVGAVRRKANILWVLRLVDWITT
jgi:ribosomal protein L28